MEKKINGLIVIIIAIVSVVATVVIASKLLDTTGKVNQGGVRVSDIIIESTAKLTEVQDKESPLTKLSDLAFDISQTNDINILLEVQQEISQINIENFSINYPQLKGNLEFGQKDYEQYEINEQLVSLPIKTEKQDDYYIVSLCLDNDNVLQDKSVDDSIEELQYDARIFDILGVDTNQLKFGVSFDLVVTDITGKIAKTTINLNMPTDETFTKGMSILRQDASQFIFTFLN